MKITTLVIIITISLLFLPDTVSAVTNNILKSEEVISITDIVKPHTLSISKEVSPKVGSFSIQGFWNPDGGKILIHAVVSWSQYEGISEIYVMNADGTALKKVVSSRLVNAKGAWIANPVWSPSGDKIVFQLTQHKGSLLAIVNSDGTGLKVIGTNFSDMGSILSFLPEAGWWQSNLKWSPDMTKVAFEFEVESEGLNKNIYTADADGSNLRQLYSDASNGNPVWSHDSKKIIFRTIGEQSSLIEINMDGTDIKYLSNGTKYRSYEWNHDDNQILYISSKEINGKEQWDLYIANADGTGTKEIMSGSSIENPSWTPDGSKILFQSNTNVYIVDADGKNIKNILKGDIKMLSWSPNREKIAFMDKYSLYTMNPDGTGKTLLALTAWGEFFQRPVYAWSPSGDKIIFSSVIDPVTGNQVDFDTFWPRRNSYEAHIFLSNPDGTEPVQLIAKEPYNVITGGWSPDGSRLIVDSSHDIEMRTRNLSIIKLSGYDEVLSVYAPLFIEQGEEFVIEVKSMSKPVEKASITLNGREIGVTDEKGNLKYSLKEPGRYQLNATKKGYKTATKTIILKESEKVQEQKITEVKETILPGKTTNTPETPGFTLMLSILGLIGSLFYNSKRRGRVL
ncbi:MAG: PEGA domain-containing protein [Candidatus Methanoperedens sp.]